MVSSRYISRGDEGSKQSIREVSVRRKPGERLAGDWASCVRLLLRRYKRRAESGQELQSRVLVPSSV